MEFGYAMAAAGLAALLALLGPALVLAGRRDARGLALLGGGAALFVLDIGLVYAPRLLGAEGMLWAWSGKVLEVGFFLALVLRDPSLRSRLGAPSELRWLRVTLLLSALTTVPSLLGGGGGAFPRWDVLAYQATMPGLAEEIVYRLVLLALFDRLGGRWEALGVQWGWGALLTTLLFYFGHALSWTLDWGLQLDLASAPDFALYGAVMCWLRYRFGSIWPCVLAHNVHNLLVVSLQPLLG